MREGINERDEGERGEREREREREFGNRNMIPNKIKMYDESLAV